MEILELMKRRRSIRKYEGKQVERESLEAIIEAGLYAPNAGGRSAKQDHRHTECGTC